MASKCTLARCPGSEIPSIIAPPDAFAKHNRCVNESPDGFADVLSRLLEIEEVRLEFSSLLSFPEDRLDCDISVVHGLIVPLRASSTRNKPC